MRWLVCPVDAVNLASHLTYLQVPEHVCITGQASISGERWVERDEEGATGRSYWTILTARPWACWCV